MFIEIRLKATTPRALTLLLLIRVCKAIATLCQNNSDPLTEAPEAKKIDIGDSLPSFTLKNEKGEDVDTATLAADKGVILFLVPKADTRESASINSRACLCSELARSWLHQAGVWIP